MFQRKGEKEHRPRRLLGIELATFVVHRMALQQSHPAEAVLLIDRHLNIGTLEALLKWVCMCVCVCVCVRDPDIFTGMRKAISKLLDMCLGVEVMPIRASASLTLSSVDSFVFTAFLPKEVQRPVFIPVNADFLETRPRNGLR